MREELYSLAEDWRVRKIFEYLKRSSYAYLDELSEKLGIGKTTLRKRIGEMAEVGIIEIKRSIEVYKEELEKWHPCKILISLKKGKEAEQFEKILNNYKVKQENLQFCI